MCLCACLRNISDLLYPTARVSEQVKARIWTQTLAQTTNPRSRFVPSRRYSKATTCLAFRFLNAANGCNLCVFFAQVLTEIEKKVGRRPPPHFASRARRAYLSVPSRELSFPSGTNNDGHSITNTHSMTAHAPSDSLASLRCVGNAPVRNRVMFLPPLTSR